MTAIILAGGKSRRMGFEKAFIEIEGTPLIKRQLKLLKRLFRKIIIVTNNPDKYKLKGLRIIQDIIPDCGPLGGIYSGLIASDTFYNFVVASDMPFINLPLIKYMISQKHGFDVVVPRTKIGHEALFAIYSKNCLPTIYKVFNTNNFRVRKIFDKVRLKEVSEGQIKKFGDPEVLFMNINRPNDLCRISTYLKK